jgi:hypothetical protein
VPTPVVELLHRAQQPERPLLHEVGERQAVILALVALGDVDDEAEVRLDEPLLGGEVAALDAACERQLLRGGEERRAADFREEGREPVGCHGRHIAPRGLSRGPLPPQAQINAPFGLIRT